MWSMTAQDRIISRTSRVTTCYHLWLNDANIQKWTDDAPDLPNCNFLPLSYMKHNTNTTRTYQHRVGEVCHFLLLTFHVFSRHFWLTATLNFCMFECDDGSNTLKMNMGFKFCAHVLLHILQIFCVHVLLHVPQINSRNVLSVSCWALSFSVSYKCLEAESVEGWRQLEGRHAAQPWEKKKQTSSNLKWSVNEWLISWSRMYWFYCWSEEHLIHFLYFVVLKSVVPQEVK